MPREVLRKYSLPQSGYFKIMQMLAFCRGRLKDLSAEEVPNKFDEWLTPKSGQYGVTYLYPSMRDLLTKADAGRSFKYWEALLEDTNITQKILAGFQAIRKNVICKTWRETQFKIIHSAIYGFNLSNPTNNPSRLTACPKCSQSATDMWHVLWSCPYIQTYWDEVMGWINARWRPAVPREPVALV